MSLACDQCGKFPCRCPSPFDTRSLNDTFRAGGNLVEERDYAHDTLKEMNLARSRPDVLAGQLRDMGITPNGDDPGD